jgi:hypothetical protein
MLIHFRLKGRRYCAFCKAPRRIYLKKNIDLTNVLLSGAFAIVVTVAAWGNLDPMAILVFCVSLAAAETFVHLRWRRNIICGLCGFDPVTYKRSPEAARVQVKQFFKEQVENPQFWLTKSPLLVVQKRIRENEKRALEHQIILNRAKSSSLAPTKPT